MAAAHQLPSGGSGMLAMAAGQQLPASAAASHDAMQRSLAPQQPQQRLAALTPEQQQMANDAWQYFSGLSSGCVDHYRMPSIREHALALLPVVGMLAPTAAARAAVDAVIADGADTEAAHDFLYAWGMGVQAELRTACSLQPAAQLPQLPPAHQAAQQFMPAPLAALAQRQPQHQQPRHEAPPPQRPPVAPLQPPRGAPQPAPPPGQRQPQHRQHGQEPLLPQHPPVAPLPHAGDQLRRQEEAQEPLRQPSGDQQRRQEILALLRSQFDPQLAALPQDARSLELLLWHAMQELQQLQAAARLNYETQRQWSLQCSQQLCESGRRLELSSRLAALRADLSGVAAASGSGGAATSAVEASAEEGPAGVLRWRAERVKVSCLHIASSWEGRSIGWRRDRLPDGGAGAVHVWRFVEAAPESPFWLCEEDVAALAVPSTMVGSLLGRMRSMRGRGHQVPPTRCLSKAEQAHIDGVQDGVKLPPLKLLSEKDVEQTLCAAWKCSGYDHAAEIKQYMETLRDTAAESGDAAL